MKQILVKIIKNYKTAFVFLLVICGMQTLGVNAQTALARGADLESSTVAKRTLVGIDSRKFVKIKDARMQKAVQQSYNALKAVANNKSKAREAGLMADFDRTIKDLKALPQPTGGGLQECDNSYALCIELCGETGFDCKLCGIGQNGCYLTKLAIEMTKDPNDPTTF
jgi:hypothetical protein